MLYCLHKSILCTDSLWNHVKVHVIPKKVSIRQISSLQEKKCVRKGYKLFAVNIRDIESDRKQCIEYFPVLEEFKDVFLEEILGLPPKQDLEFSIELTRGSFLASKAPYCMSAQNWWNSNYSCRS